MSEVPVQLIVAAFQDEKSADMALKELKQARREKLIGIENAAVIRKDQKGKLHIKETADMGGGKGAALGGVAGAAIGLIAGPALLVPAAVGALVGGLAAKLRDSGFSDERLKTIGDSLEPGSSAIIAVVEHKWVAQVEKELAEAGADMFTQALSADIAEQLEAGHEVAYTALSSQEGFAVSRVAGGEEQVEGGSLIVNESGAYGSRFLATEEGFAVEQLTATEGGVVDEVLATDGENVVYGAAVATDEGVAAVSATGKLESGEEESEEQEEDK
jgi:uncharacterized membrane protein